VLAPGAVLNGDAVFVAFVLVGGAGYAALVRRRRDEERAIVLALLAMTGVTVLVAWLSAQFSPAWTARYFAVVLGPVLLLGARGLVRAERRGLVALAVVLFLWLGFSVRDDKENARSIMAGVSGFMHPGELVVSTHPEQVPVLRYYLGSGYRFATTMGPVPDARIFDWRNAVGRLRASNMQARVDQTVAAVRPGSEFVVVAPVFRDYRAWDATWTHLVWEKSTAYTSSLQRDPRVRLVHHVVTNEIALKRNYFKPLQAFVYRRLR
jgi:mannosyltransferase